VRTRPLKPASVGALSCSSLCRYGFVRYGTVAEAQAAIAMLDGTSVLGHSLQVKFADADAGAAQVLVPC
jgi:hypothetical protein